MNTKIGTILKILSNKNNFNEDIKPANKNIQADESGNLANNKNPFIIYLKNLMKTPTWI